MRRDPEALRAALDALDADHRRRRRLTVSARSGADAGQRIVVDGHAVVDFASNDYLGLARHPAGAVALRHALEEFGTGGGAAHLVSGHCAPHEALERALAGFTRRERALLFTSGYAANLGVLQAFAGRGESILEDRLNHASLLDGARLAGAKLLRYAHADAADAARRLAGSPSAAIVATDGVFSMDGDCAPLPALAKAAASHRAWFVVDDAHGLGVLGPDGAGSVAAAGLDAAAVPILIGTLGKAFGTAGAFVAGDRDVIDYLMQRARTYIYTTAAPPALAAATLAALETSRREPERRARLHAHIATFGRRAAQAGLAPAPSATPIQPILIGEEAETLRLRDALLTAGFLVGAIRPPTVPAGTARLRVALSAAHEERDIIALVDALARLRTARAA